LPPEAVFVGNAVLSGVVLALIVIDRAVVDLALEIGLVELGAVVLQKEAAVPRCSSPATTLSGRASDAFYGMTASARWSFPTDEHPSASMTTAQKWHCWLVHRAD
jgi:hypothetical protein